MSLNDVLTGLSSSCQSALPGLLTSSFASCANVLGLVSVATSSGSIVEPLTSYIEDLCTTTPCTASDLSGAKTIIDNGCSTDIANGSVIPTALELVIDNFGGVRSLLCTKYTSNNTYCVPEVLSAAQNSSGTELSLSTLTSLLSSGDATSFLSTIPKSVYCTDCGDAITTEAIAIAANVSAGSEDTIKNAASQQCGASFADGNLPSTISTAGGSGVASSSSSDTTTGAAFPSVVLSSKGLGALATITAIVAGVGLAFA